MSQPALMLNTIRLGDPGRPAVVILHGLFGSATNWRSIGRGLSEQHQVCIMDLRNHGDSPWHDEMDYPQMAADVVATLDRLQIDRPVLLGHSMGGKTAMALAQLDLAPLSGLIVADIAPLSYPHDHDEFIAAMSSLDVDSLRSRGDADRLLSVRVAEVATRQFLLQNLVRQGDTFRWRVNLRSLQQNMTNLLGWNIDRPSDLEALFIAGGESPYIQGEGREAIRNQFPRATVETLAGAGHWLHAEQPQTFSQLVQDYLESVGSSH